MKCINPMKHRPEFEGKNECKQCELEAETVEKICECDESIPRHSGVHPQICKRCGEVIE